MSLVLLFAAGSYVNSQVQANLFQGRVEQALSESKRTANEFVTRIDLLQNPDKVSVQKQVNDVISNIQNPTNDSDRQFSLFLPAGQKESWVSTRSSTGFNVDSISQSLHDSVSTGAGQFWQSTTMFDGTKTVPAIIVGSQVQLPPGVNYELYFVYDLSSQQSRLDAIRNILYIAGGVLLFFLTLGGYFVAHRTVGPVKRAATVSEKVAAGDLNERLNVKGHDEMARLGTSFNKMTGSLADKITALEQLSKVQQGFVSDVSHELRTPLTTINMASELLYATKDDMKPTEKRSVELLHAQVERFQELLAELLEISRFDAGAAEIYRKEQSLLTIVQSSRHDIAEITEKNKSRIDIFSDGSSVIAEIDSRRVNRIVRNLLVNAVEHSEGNPVSVYMASNDDVIAFAVADRGIGMSAENVERVFDRFWRADPSRVRTTGGTGLGTTIAKEDAKLHRGDLTVCSEEKIGSTFLLSLPRDESKTLTKEPIKLGLAQEILRQKDWKKLEDDIRDV